MSEERPGAREVVAVFASEQAFSDAIDTLETNGVDRARISVLETGTPEQGAALRAKGFTSVGDLLDAGNVPKTVYMQPEDVGAARGLAISGLVYVGAALGAGLTAAAAPVLAPMLAAAAVGGATGGGIGAFLTRRLGAERSAYIARSLAHGGLVMWVAASDEDEHRIIAMLTEHGGEHVHARSMG